MIQFKAGTFFNQIDVLLYYQYLFKKLFKGYYVSPCTMHYRHLLTQTHNQGNYLMWICVSEGEGELMHSTSYNVMSMISEKVVLGII